MPRHPLTVGRLRETIAGLCDDAPVLVTAPDHSYRLAYATSGTALYDNDLNIWSEDFGELDSNLADKPRQRLNALIID